MEQQTKKKKSPFLAAFLSFLWCGLGQIYNEQVTKGIALAIFTLIAFISSGGFSVLILPWLIIFDAYRIAERINAGERVETWQCF